MLSFGIRAGSFELPMEDLNTTDPYANDHDAVSLIVNVGDMSKESSETPKEVDKEVVGNDGISKTTAK